MSKISQMIEYLQADNQWHTSEEIAVYLGVTSRTVKNYIKKLDSSIKVISSKKGYKIEQADIQSDEEEEIHFNRVNTVINTLINSDDRVNIYDLSEKLSLSESVVINLLKEARLKVVNYDLKLEREGDFWKITGSERNKRRMLSSLLYEESAQGLLSISVLETIFPNVDVAQIYSLIKQASTKFDVYLTTFDINNILLHLLIAIQREKVVSIQKKRGKAVTFSEYIVTNTENIANLFFDETDYEELVEIIRLSISRKEIPENIGDEVYRIINDLVGYIKNIYDVNLDVERFRKQFSLHLSRLIERVRKNEKVYNPMVKSIKNESPTIYECAVLVAHRIGELCNLEINEDETAFIALHIGNILAAQIENAEKIKVAILMAEYGDNSQIFLQKLQEKFGDTIVITNVIHDIKDIDFQNTDMIITVGENFSNLGITTVTISPFLLSRDISKLTDAINYKKSELKRKSFQRLLTKFIPQSNFSYSDKVEQRKSFFQFVTKEFEKHEIVTGDFEQSLEQRENISSTAFGRVALPHSLKMDAKKSEGYIYVNPKGIKWGQDITVYLVITLAISMDDKKIFREIFDVLSNIITDPANISKLIENKTYEEFVSCLLKMIV